MKRNLRLFVIGGVIAYRALFNWIRPVMYVTTMLGSPLFQILFFAYLGRHTRAAPQSFFVVGNAVQVSAMAGIYAGTMTIANERQFGTLAAVLATPANRIALFTGRAVPVIGNGMLVSAFGFGVGWAVFGLRIPASSLPALVLVLAVTVSSCTALGLLLGSDGLRARDVFLTSNLVYFLTLLLCGVNVPRQVLPGWMSTIGSGIPLTHGIEAARSVIAGHSLAFVERALVAEALVGLVYTACAFVLFTVFEHEGRRTGSLQNM